MISSQIQSFDAAFGGSSQTSSTGASWNGTRHPAWLNGIGAQFAGHSSGLSGEQQKANHEKVCPVVSGHNERPLTSTEVILSELGVLANDI